MSLDRRVVAVVRPHVRHAVRPLGVDERVVKREERKLEAARKPRTSAFRRTMSFAARSSPLFHGRTSTIATRSPSLRAFDTIPLRFCAAVSIGRRCTMSLMPPSMTIASTPSTAASKRRAISSVRSPFTPWLRNSKPGCARAAHQCHWLRSSGASIVARTAGFGSHSGEPAVIESPRQATITIGSARNEVDDELAVERLGDP